MKKVIILYGEMGAGKSYQGKPLAASLGYAFLEGDNYLPAHMVERVQKFLPLSPEMVNEFVFIDLVMAIVEASKKATGLVVAQALYLRETREALQNRLQALGFDVEFKLIQVPFFQNLRQLFSRPKGIRWVLYWLANKPFFQP